MQNQSLAEFCLARGIPDLVQNLEAKGVTNVEALQHLAALPAGVLVNGLGFTLGNATRIIALEPLRRPCPRDWYVRVCTVVIERTVLPGGTASKCLPRKKRATSKAYPRSPWLRVRGTDYGLRTHQNPPPTAQTRWKRTIRSHHHADRHGQERRDCVAALLLGSAQCVDHHPANRHPDPDRKEC